MTNVQATKLNGYPWSDLFNLVLDVKRYPEFVPHCREVRLLSHKMEEPGMTIKRPRPFRRHHC
jgi:ribosome-associated toxin RatA of RatAB toxin-antitoxin module